MFLPVTFRLITRFSNNAPNKYKYYKRSFSIMTLLSTEKEVTIKAPWGNIAGLTWGDPSNPPVFLAPGRMEPCSAFRPLVLKLPQDFYYVAVDFPGNGFSDHFPKGLRFTIYDFVPTVVRVQEHFGWETFVYIGHSLGAAVGKIYNMVYPGRLTRIVDLDPVPAYHTVVHDDMATWYKNMYGEHYTEDAYRKHTGGKERAPQYTYQQRAHFQSGPIVIMLGSEDDTLGKLKELFKFYMNTCSDFGFCAREMFIKVQGLTEEAADCNLERLLEPSGNGLYRLTYDQRMKNTFVLPFTAENLRAMYTLTDVPTLAILAQDMVKFGVYDHVPFAMDQSAWPHGNYTCKVVPGNHDVHVNNPDVLANDVTKFLIEGTSNKSKL